jgi:D-alanyl-D-alanine endopeptidase (penicillin-binding protein 7)
MITGTSMRWEQLGQALLALVIATALVCAVPQLSLAATSVNKATSAKGTSSKARATRTKRAKARRGQSVASRIAQTIAIATATGSVRVNSTSLLVLDEATSDVLLSRNADVVRPIASITKLMTTMVVLEARQPLDELIEITQEDRVVEPTSRLAVGTVLTREDLIHLALMSSENRAANALARNMPGGFPAAIESMNMKALEIGMTRTHFADATGLSVQNVASPADLSRMVIEASRNPVIREFSTTPSYYVPGKMAGNVIEYRNTNALVGQPGWDIVLQKTGYTTAAGRCLVMKTLVEDRPVIMVLMNSVGKLTRIADASRIRTWMETASRAALGAGAGN